jgi:hypothetical protein
MPLKMHQRVVRKVTAALFGMALLVAAVPAVATAACPSTSSSTLLAQFGDNAAYTLLSGSTFESGASGWSLSNAEVLGSAGAVSGSSALEIQPGGTAVSQSFCVNSEDPTFRFFARQISGGGVLSVSLRWMNGHVFNNTIPVGTIQGGSSWSLSPSLQLATKLPLLMPGSTATVELVFESNRGMFEPGRGGTWAIDNVYIDPHSR